MRITVLDLETKVEWLASGKIDGSPFNPNNEIVSCGIKHVINNKEQDLYVFLNHEDSQPEDKNSPQIIQDILDNTDLLIMHNGKFDLSWLKESGFTYSGAVWDTMNCAYVMARGIKIVLTLEACALRAGVSEKKKSIIEDYWNKKIGYEKMPRGAVSEYGMADVQSTWELYQHQQLLLQNNKHSGLVPVIDLANELLIFLGDTERAGIYVDRDILSRVEHDYILEKQGLVREIDSLVHQYMGDQPYNLGSPEQLSSVIYSRKVIDKKLWQSAFNIGLDERGKPLRRPRMSSKDLRQRILENTQILYKTRAEQCKECRGSGRIEKLKKDGTLFKNFPKCLNCKGVGIDYIQLKEIAGLQMPIRSIKDLTSSGFSTDKECFEYLASLPKISSDAKNLLTKLIRLNQVETYLSTFVQGTKNALRSNSILHTSFNQCVTATGRLSSSSPNWQNIPRGNTFPLKECVVSRFKDGSIAEIDFAQLEYRIAAELSGCEFMKKDILDGVDVHRFTSETLTTAGQPTTRQEAKPKSFRPIFGGQSGTPAEVIYNKAFMEKYKGLQNWHDELLNQICYTKLLRTPSGREFRFPDAFRQPSGYVTQSTQAKNYPVQSVATADLVPIACILLYYKFMENGLESLIINTVHDSLISDVFPGEEDIVCKLMIEACMEAKADFKRRFGYEITIPLGVELKMGDSWLNMKEIAKVDEVQNE